MSHTVPAKWASHLRGCSSLDLLNREFAGYMCVLFNRVGTQLWPAGQAAGIARELTRVYEERADEICGVAHAGVSSSA